MALLVLGTGSAARGAGASPTGTRAGRTGAGASGAVHGRGFPRAAPLARATVGPVAGRALVSVRWVKARVMKQEERYYWARPPVEILRQQTENLRMARAGNL